MVELDQELAQIDPTLTEIARIYFGKTAVEAASTITPVQLDSASPTNTLLSVINTQPPDRTTEAQDTPSPSATSSPTFTSTPSPTLTPTATIDPEKIIDQDDYSLAGRWFTMTAQQFVIEYTSGGYRIYSMATTPVWSVIRNGLKDVILEVDVIALKGLQDSFVGLVCRQKNDRFYSLAISPNGTAEIEKIAGADFESLAITSFPQEEIKPDINRLRAECVGSRLALYLNGELLLQAEDSSFASGAVGLLAGNRSSPGIDVIFDNFLILQP